MHFLCFLAVFEHMSDSLTTTLVKSNQCPSHQSILLTQGPIHENFMKKYWELAELENEVFLRRPFWIFWVGHFELFLLHFSEKPSPFIWGIIFFCIMDDSSRILETFMHTTVPLHKHFVCTKITLLLTTYPPLCV